MCGLGLGDVAQTLYTWVKSVLSDVQALPSFKKVREGNNSMTLVRRQRRPADPAVYEHTHTPGWESLIACIILQAIRDADQGDTDANLWLTSDRCGEFLDYLNLPDVNVLATARQKNAGALHKIKFARRGVKPRIRLAS